MWEEDELSDDDLRSVYGEAALRVRTFATLDRLERKIEAQLRHHKAMQRRLEQGKQGEMPLQNSS